MSDVAKSAWEVFALFVIPIGGGIPAGVVLAKTRGLGWPTMAGLYFLSDVLLAIVFEPVMLFVIHRGKSSPKLTHFLTVLRESSKRTTPKFVDFNKPHTLIAAAFVVDPMTGRALSKASGYGFLKGWAIAIAGDMLYFSVIMVSTLWLSHVLGDGTLAMVIILVAMFLLPPAIERLQKRRLRRGG